MSRYGYYFDYDNYFAWMDISTSSVSMISLCDAHLVRPVFYLNSDQVIQSGNGKMGNPFILS